MSSKKHNQRSRQTTTQESPKRRKVADVHKVSANLGEHLAKTSEKKLSEKLSAMKFMQRSIVKEAHEKEILESKKKIAEAHWVVKYSTLPIERPKIKVAYETGYFSWGSADTHTAGGRKSYGSFNSTVENLEKQRREALAAIEEQKVVKDLNIDDEEMTSYMTKIKD